MNNDDFDKEFHYQIHWSQDYPELQEIIDREMNNLLESSGYKEANEVIAKIKSTLKDSK